MSVAPNNFYSLQVTLATANTAQPVQPTSTTPGQEAPQISSAVIKAAAGNATAVWLGGPGVTATTGYELSPGTAVGIDALGLSKLFFVGGATGLGISALMVGP